MSFFLDHDVPAEIARVLIREGHAVTELQAVLPRTSNDREVLAYAFAQNSVLITCNRDDFTL